MWLDERLDAVVRQVNQRIKVMTDLDQTHSEMLQIANYGLGGHYEPHYDMAVVSECAIRGEINAFHCRMASTWRSTTTTTVIASQRSYFM